MKIYKVKNMDCAACATMIELDLEDAGISAKCSYANQTLEVAAPHDEAKIKEVVKKSGYDITL
jgi:copper chaperone CopZ